MIDLQLFSAEDQHCGPQATNNIEMGYDFLTECMEAIDRYPATGQSAWLDTHCADEWNAIPCHAEHTADTAHIGYRRIGHCDHPTPPPTFE